MKQVFLSGHGQAEVFDVPAPGATRGSVLVRNAYSVISSGTEGAAITKSQGVIGLAEKMMNSRERLGEVWNMVQERGLSETVALIRNKLGEFRAIGYSSAGTVIQCDADTGFRVGQRVACMGTGFANHAQFVSVPKNLVVPLVPEVPVELSAFGALGCIAIQGLRRLELTPGERIAVVGLGLIGQMALRIATAMGYEAFGFDIDQARVDHAARHAGARLVMNSATSDAEAAVAQATGGVGLDGVMICASSDSDTVVNRAFDLCRKRGRVSVVGDIGLALERARMYAKELELRISCSYGPGRYDVDYEIAGRDYPLAHARWTERRNLEYFVGLLATGRLQIGDLVSERIAVENARDAYAHIKTGNPTVFGVLLDYGHSEEAARSDIFSSAYRPTTNAAKSGRLRVGLVGTGGYATNVHLPNLQRIDSVIIRATASKSGASAGVVARKAKAEYATSDYSRLLQDDAIDAVVISTRHASHAGLVLASLAAGKHVYVEKPLALTVADCVRVVEAQQQAKVVLRVGFNRRFSPYLREMKRAVGNGRRLVNIRVSVGDVGGHWSNTSAEGGRLMGEAVHFVDLANWLFDAAPQYVSAHFLGTPDRLNPNVSIGITYADGSVANIAYVTVGNTLSGKEFIELNGNGRTVIMNDYKTLTGFGCRVASNRLQRGDKGQLGAMAEFVAAASRGQADSGADAMAGLLATTIIAAAVESASRREVVDIARFVAANSGNESVA